MYTIDIIFGDIVFENHLTNQNVCISLSRRKEINFKKQENTWTLFLTFHFMFGWI